MATFASSSVPISTNPNPFERPVALSMMIFALTTAPADAKSPFRSASVVSYGRLPINSLFPIILFSLLAGLVRRVPIIAYLVDSSTMRASPIVAFWLSVSLQTLSLPLVDAQPAPISRHRAQFQWLRERHPEHRERFSISVIGDAEKGRFPWERFFSPGDEAFTLQLKDVQSRAPDFIFQLGDLVSVGTPENFQEMLSLLSTESTVPFFSIIGNHDRSAPNGPADKSEYRRAFGDTDFYFDYNGWRFIGLDSSDRRLTPEQIRWLQHVLSAPQRKIIFTHVPPAFLRGKFGGGDAASESKMPALPQDYWDDVLTAYFAQGSAEFEQLVGAAKVDRVYMGHIHAFAAAEHHGVGYVLTGGGGSPLYPLPRSFPQTMMAHTIWAELSPDGVKETVRVLSGETFPLFP